MDTSENNTLIQTLNPSHDGVIKRTVPVSLIYHVQYSITAYSTCAFSQTLPSLISAQYAQFHQQQQSHQLEDKIKSWHYCQRAPSSPFLTCFGTSVAIINTSENSKGRAEQHWKTTKKISFFILYLTVICNSSSSRNHLETLCSPSHISTYPGRTKRFRLSDQYALSSLPAPLRKTVVKEDIEPLLPSQPKSLLTL